MAENRKKEGKRGRGDCGGMRLLLEMVANSERGGKRQYEIMATSNRLYFGSISSKQKIGGKRQEALTATCNGLGGHKKQDTRGNDSCLRSIVYSFVAKKSQKNLACHYIPYLVPATCGMPTT